MLEYNLLFSETLKAFFASAAPLHAPLGFRIAAHPLPEILKI